MLFWLLAKKLSFKLLGKKFIDDGTSFRVETANPPETLMSLKNQRRGFAMATALQPSFPPAS